MPATPTVEGSIVAYLRLNDSDWNAKLDAAEQRARDLGRIDPNIRVTADTADAIAKLDAVRLAAERVGGDHVTTVTTVNESVNNASGSGQASAAAATDSLAAASKKLEAAQNALTRAQAAEEAAARAAANAASTQYLAELRLQDVQDKRGRTEYQLAAAEEAVARSTRNAEAAEARQIATQAAAAAAAEKLAAVQAALGAAEDDSGKKTDDANKSHAANLGYMGTILAVVAALVPVMSQLAGYVAGVGGAFLGMGAAGVLAVLGIKNAMADGTTSGLLFGSVVDQLKTNLTGLEQTAAANILGPLASAVDEMTAAMPQLSSEIGGFAADLGTIGSTVMGTLVQGFAILNPLFREGASYLQGLATAWQSWVNNGGLQKFAQDAENSLPLVANTLGQITKLIVNVIAAMAPIGTVVLTVIDALAAGLNAIPAGNLVEIATGATAAFLAFKAWAVLGPILETVATAVGAVGVATDIAEGPVGWIIGLVGLAGGVVAALATSTQDNTAATTAYTTALQQSNGALDDNVRKTVAKQLADANVLETAKQYHIELSRLTDAILGNASDQAYVNDQIQKFGTHLVEVHGYQGQVTNSYTTLTDKARALSDVVNGQNKSLTDSVKAYQDQTAAAQSSDAAEEQQIQATNQLTTALNAQTNAATFLNNAFKLLNGTNLSVAQAQTAQAAAFNTVTAALQQNGTQVEGNSKAAVANQQAIQQAATAAQQLAAATTTATGSTDQGTQSFMQSKAALEQQLQAQGELTPAVQTYIDTLFKVPPELTTQLNVDNAAALATIQQTQNALNALARSEAATGVGATQLATTGRISAAFAGGGTVGGTGTATSDSVLARLSRTEEVISNDRGQADRYRSALKAINQGASPLKVATAAMGGTNVGLAPQPMVQHVHQWTIYTNNGEQLYQAFTAKINSHTGP